MLFGFKVYRTEAFNLLIHIDSRGVELTLNRVHAGGVNLLSHLCTLIVGFKSITYFLAVVHEVEDKGVLFKRVDKGEVVVKHITYYADLLAAAHEAGIKHLNTEAVQLPCAANGETAVVKAVIETGRGSFCALGDASPRNVEAEFLPHLIRVAETRAKARALRDALNIGVVAYEEISGRIMATERATTNETTKTPMQPQAAMPTTPKATPPNPNRESDYWSEKQRKLIFRLLGKRGVEGDTANEKLREIFNVKDLRLVRRRSASDYIDKLMRDNGAGHEEAAHA